LQLTYVSIKSNANTTEFTMPMITVRYATARRKSGLTEMIAKAASRLSADILHKNRLLTAVTVEQIAPEDWFIGDKSLTRHGLASFWLDIRIVDGTNTREEKAAFVAATFAKMSELLGPLHNESYVHVNDVRGDAYGYGGLTQNERYFAGKMKAPNAAAA
jgi:4-oxalocrotonate tautomerase